MYPPGGRARPPRAERLEEEYYERDRYPRYSREREPYRDRRDYHEGYPEYDRGGGGGRERNDPRAVPADSGESYEREAYGHDYTRDTYRDEYREERPPRRDPRDPPSDEYVASRRALNAVWARGRPRRRRDPSVEETCLWRACAVRGRARRHQNVYSAVYSARVETTLKSSGFCSLQTAFRGSNCFVCEGVWKSALMSLNPGGGDAPGALRFCVLSFYYWAFSAPDAVSIRWALVARLWRPARDVYRLPREDRGDFGNDFFIDLYWALAPQTAALLLGRLFHVLALRSRARSTGDSVAQTWREVFIVSARFRSGRCIDRVSWKRFFVFLCAKACSVVIG